MKRIMTIAVSLMVCLALAAATASAGTLYDQEGTTDDGTPSIDASGQAPEGSDASSNWKYQYGDGSWTGVYAGSDGWEVIDEDGDMTLEVEADVEMYFTQSVSNNKIYFHLGNIYDAGLADKTAYVDGSFSTNNGQYIGISFLGTSKDESSFEKDADTGEYTGVILDGMQSDRDTWREQDNQMDVEILLNWGAGWTAPVNYGDGAHNTVTDTLWWLVDDGNAGTYDYRWRVRLLPEADQPDGDYYLDPAVVSAPVL